MSLPLPPPLPLPLPPAKPRLNWDERFVLTKLGPGKMELCIDGNKAPLTRAECFFLVGKLERMGATL